MKVVKDKKVIAGVAVLALLAVGGTAYATNQSKQQLAQEQAVIDKEQQTMNKIQLEVKKLVDGEYLIKDVSLEQIEKLQAQYEKSEKSVTNTKKAKTSSFEKEKEQCKQLLDSVSYMATTQAAVNQLFQDKDKVAMNGSTITNELAIVDELKNDTIQELKATLPEEATTAFDKSVAELVKQAEEQVKQIEKATDAVAKVYKDDKVISTDGKTYETAKNEVEKIKNEKAKKALSEKLDKVKVALEKNDENKTEPTNEEQAGTAESNGAGQTTENTGGGSYTPPASDGGGSYTPPASDGGGSYTPPASDGGGSYTPPASDGGGSYTPPASDGGNSGSSVDDGGPIYVGPDDIQGSEENDHGGSNEWWGW